MGEGQRAAESQEAGWRVACGKPDLRTRATTKKHAQAHGIAHSQRIAQCHPCQFPRLHYYRPGDPICRRFFDDTASPQGTTKRRTSLTTRGAVTTISPKLPVPVDCLQAASRKQTTFRPREL